MDSLGWCNSWKQTALGRKNIGSDELSEEEMGSRSPSPRAGMKADRKQERLRAGSAAISVQKTQS
jgi:hypothetical protein